MSPSGSLEAMPLRVTVRYFAAAREHAGRGEEQLELADGATVKDLAEALAAKHPGLAALLPRLRLALDEEFAAPTDLLRDGAEVALIPPVAGGAPDCFRVVDRPLELEEVVRAVSAKGQGGVVTFSGAVRDVTRGRAVVQLDYEAYVPMAEKQLRAIGAEAAARWPGVRVAVVHRVGALAPGELAVVIAASAPHRQDAFLACQHVIDRLKQDVPIWKKERFQDGEVWVGLGP